MRTEAYWHKKYMDSPLNYPLVWKNILKSNLEVMERIKQIRESNTRQMTSIQMQQFFEMWAYSIRNPSFEMAKKTNEEMMADVARSIKPYQDTYTTFLRLPKTGRDKEEIIAEMDALKSKEESKWKDGFVSGAVYHGDEAQMPRDSDLLHFSASRLKKFFDHVKSYPTLYNKYCLGGNSRGRKRDGRLPVPQQCKSPSNAAAHTH